MSILNETYKLHNGEKIPKLGFGTWQIPEGEVAYASVMMALKNGYRHIDTASAYGNEKSVGRAIRDSGINRSEIYVTTKVPAEIKDYKKAVDIIDKSLELLNIEYIDLLLIHAPKPWRKMWWSKKNYDKQNIEVYKALEEAYAAKKVKAIGLSNFSVKEIKNITENSSIKPHANQIAFYIGRTWDEITNYCQENDILVEGYSPMATGRAFKNDVIKNMATKYNKTVSQICLRYVLERGVLPLPKSTHENYIIQNSELDFEITKEDMDYLNSLKEIIKRFLF